jgi:Co/Zn/Cd efflux system component
MLRYIRGRDRRECFTAIVPKTEVMGALGLAGRLPSILPAPDCCTGYRSTDSQAMSVWLCTRDDCIANIAVILASAGVWACATAWPDTAVAAIIAYLSLLMGGSRDGRKR